MPQSRRKSLAEAATSATAGLATSAFISYVVLPLVNVEATHTQAFGIMMAYWCISCLKTFTIRRLFTAKPDPNYRG